MVNHKYGEFADMQISKIKQIIRKRIFFLLLVAEDEVKTNKTKFPDVNLEQANTTLLWRLSGLNELLGTPTELVIILSLLEEAKNTIQPDNFDYKKYRKLILDAGAEVMNIACPNEDEVQNLHLES